MPPPLQSVLRAHACASKNYRPACEAITSASMRYCPGRYYARQLGINPLPAASELISEWGDIGRRPRSGCVVEREGGRPRPFESRLGSQLPFNKHVLYFSITPNTVAATSKFTVFLYKCKIWRLSWQNCPALGGQSLHALDLTRKLLSLRHPGLLIRNSHAHPSPSRQSYELWRLLVVKRGNYPNCSVLYCVAVFLTRVLGLVSFRVSVCRLN